MKRIHGSILGRFIFSYIIILAIPFVVVMQIYNNMVAVIKQDMYNSIIALLRQNSNVVDQNLDTIYDYVLLINSSQTVDDYLKIESPYLDRTSISDFLIVQKALPVLYANNLDPVPAIYSVKSNCMISPSAIQFQSDKLYSLHTIAADGLDYEQWSAGFLTSTFKYHFNASRSYNVVGITDKDYIAFANSILGTGDELLGNLFIFIPESSLLSLIGFTQGTQYSYACILNQEGEILSEYQQAGTPAVLPEDLDFSDSSGFYEINLDGVDTLVAYCNDSDFGWCYVAATPLSVINQRLDTLRVSIIVLIAALALIGVLLSCLLAYRNVLPIRKLIDLLIRSDNERKDDWSFTRLDDALKNIISNSNELRAELDRQMPSMRAALFSRWLNGDFTDNEHIIREFEHSGISLDYGCHIVVIMSYEMLNSSSRETLGTKRAIIKTLLRQEIPGLIDIYDMDFNTMAFVCGSREQDQQLCRKTISGYLYTIQSLLYKKVELQTSYAGSITGSDVSRVYIAYGEAQQAMASHQQRNNDDVITWYRAEIPVPQKTIYYPIDIEMKLLLALRTGNEKNTDQILSQLYSENIIKNAINPDQLRHLITSLQSTLIRLYQNHAQDAEIYTGQLREVIAGIREDQGSETHEKVRKVFLMVCREMHDINQRKQQCLNWQIEQYVMENFRAPQFSLQTLADHFGYTGTYMSRFFKEQIGEQFYIYLTNLRMKEAAKLLSLKNMSVEEISGLVGYNSSQVFRRVFRRQYGCTPLEYVQQDHRDSNAET